MSRFKTPSTEASRIFRTSSLSRIARAGTLLISGTRKISASLAACSTGIFARTALAFRRAKAVRLNRDRAGFWEAASRPCEPKQEGDGTGTSEPTAAGAACPIRWNLEVSINDESEDHRQADNKVNAHAALLFGEGIDSGSGWRTGLFNVITIWSMLFQFLDPPSGRVAPVSMMSAKLGSRRASTMRRFISS